MKVLKYILLLIISFFIAVVVVNGTTTAVTIADAVARRIQQQPWRTDTVSTHTTTTTTTTITTTTDHDVTASSSSSSSSPRPSSLHLDETTISCGQQLFNYQLMIVVVTLLRSKRRKSQPPPPPTFVSWNNHNHHVMNVFDAPTSILRQMMIRGGSSGDDILDDDDDFGDDDENDKNDDDSEEVDDFDNDEGEDLDENEEVTDTSASNSNNNNYDGDDSDDDTIEDSSDNGKTTIKIGTSTTDLHNDSSSDENDDTLQRDIDDNNSKQSDNEFVYDTVHVERSDTIHSSSNNNKNESNGHRRNVDLIDGDDNDNSFAVSTADMMDDPPNDIDTDNDNNDDDDDDNQDLYVPTNDGYSPDDDDDNDDDYDDIDNKLQVENHHDNDAELVEENQSDDSLITSLMNDPYVRVKRTATTTIHNNDTLDDNVGYDDGNGNDDDMIYNSTNTNFQNINRHEENTSTPATRSTDGERNFEISVHQVSNNDSNNEIDDQHNDETTGVNIDTFTTSSSNSTSGIVDVAVSTTTATEINTDDDMVVPSLPSAMSGRSIDANVTRKTLVQKLNYKKNEIVQLKPEIAAVIVKNNLFRPQEGIPTHWLLQHESSSSSQVSARMRYINKFHGVLTKRILPTVVMGIVVLIASPSISSVSKNMNKPRLQKRQDRTFVSNKSTSSLMNATTTTAPTQLDNSFVPPSTQLGVSTLGENHVVHDDVQEDNKEVSTMKPENIIRSKSVKPGTDRQHVMVQELDVTWLDKILTIMENKMKSCFQRKL